MIRFAIAICMFALWVGDGYTQGTVELFSQAFQQCNRNNSLCHKACGESGSSPYAVWNRCFNQCERTWKLCANQVNLAHQAHNRIMQYCNSIPSHRGNYERAWDDVVRDKRKALSDGIDAIKQIRGELNKDYSTTVGEPGSARDASIAIALVARETTDLIERLAKQFNPPASPTVDFLRDVREKIDHAREKANGTFQGSASPLIDELPTFIPGIQLARDMKSWDDARSAYRMQLERIERSIRGMEAKLHQLGGPERVQSIDQILKNVQAQRQQCEATAKAQAANLP